MEYNLGDNPVTSHSWNANRTRKFNLIDQIIVWNILENVFDFMIEY